MSLPLFLKPKASYNLIRVGRDNDGGYLVEKKSLEISKSLISLGIYDDWSFEKKFLKINQNSKIYCYDSQVSLSFFKKKIIKQFFFVYYFGFSELFKTINLYFDFKKFFSNHFFLKHHIFYNDIKKILSEHNLDDAIFFKIDIEGSEYRILKELVSIKKKISGVCIEFHDVDLNLDKIKKFIEEIDLTLVHIHPNNYAKKDINNNPTVLELTFARNPISYKKELTLPNFLDQKNNSLEDDINIEFKLS